MRTILLIIITQLSFYFLSAQDFSTIDIYARNTPKSKTNNPTELAEYLNTQTNSDLEKVRAYYVWLTHHIAYDTYSFFSGNSNYETNPEATLKKRKAVCQGYSELFKALCDVGGIPCFIVDGYSKGYGYKSGKHFTSTDHAWNIVFVNGKWQQIDATWGAGHVTENQKFEFYFNEENFLPQPEKFLLKHLPADPMWQLLSCPLTMDEYLKNDSEIEVLLKEKEECFHFNDTIQNYLSLDNTQQMINTSERAYRFYPENVDKVGYAYLTLAYELGQELAPLYERGQYQKALELSFEILRFDEIALLYFKKSKTEYGKSCRKMAQTNIDSMKEGIKGLEEYLNN